MGLSTSKIESLMEYSVLFPGIHENQTVLFMPNERNFDNVRIGILLENTGARKFWTSLGFKLYTNKKWREKDIECFEKQLK